MKKVFLIGVCILIAFLVFVLPISRLGNTPIDPGTLEIPKGTTLYGLQDVLGLDMATWKYKLWIKRNYPDFTLSAGSYPVASDMTLDSLFDEVLRYQPQADDVEITILPGWHIGEVQDALQATFKTSETNFDLVVRNTQLVDSFSDEYAFLQGVRSLEGFLYPDTYRVYPDASLEDVVKVMLTRFEETIYDQYSQDTGDLSFYDTLKLSSIIEEEEKNETNKPMVADVYKKRLRDGWQLGADATLCYEGLVDGDDCQTFVNNYYSSSTEYRKSKGYRYDTRLTVGLPPTPISSVSISSFDAVVNSKKNPYYYYLHDNKGNIHFGETASDHNANKQNHLYR